MFMVYRDRAPVASTTKPEADVLFQLEKGKFTIDKSNKKSCARRNHPTRVDT